MALRLHRFRLSGHSHRAELFVSLLGMKADLVDVDLAGGAHKRSDFLALNPFGQVPVLEDEDVVIADSNAILVYLATRYDPSGRWLPRDAARTALVQRWLSVAAGPVAHGSAAARLAAVFGADIDVPRAQATAGRLHTLLDDHLQRQPYIAGEGPTIADVALYSYTAKAPEGGVSLEPHPDLRAWLARIEALPGFVPMPDAPRRRAPEERP
jgi:glutathione S-transferase